MTVKFTICLLEEMKRDGALIHTCHHVQHLLNHGTFVFSRRMALCLAYDLGVGHCCYLKRIMALHVFGPTMLLPECYRQVFSGMGKSVWILLRHGSETWPVEVVDELLHSG